MQVARKKTIGKTEKETDQLLAKHFLSLTEEEEEEEERRKKKEEEQKLKDVEVDKKDK